MKYVRMPIEVESPEERGYSTIRFNLAESSVTDRTLGEFELDLSGAVLAYGDHRGLPALRKEIAQDTGVSEADVLVTAGAAGGLFIIATSLLGPDDHLVVVRPNYATNLETPRAIGCAIDIIDVAFEHGFRPRRRTLARCASPQHQPDHAPQPDRRLPRPRHARRGHRPRRRSGLPSPRR